MKKTVLKKIKDGGVFQLSQRSNVQYEMIRKEKKMATFTSTGSDRSFVRSVDTVCYI